jgi:asparaginyl-tRNA synthetase
MATSAAASETPGQSVYVDEMIGNDESGDGSIQKPYQSAAQAIVNHGPSPPLVIMTRKSEEEEWAAIGISALKKARKGAEGIEKKKKKALEAQSKAAEKAAEQEKAKNLVIEEDMTLPAATKVGPIPGLRVAILIRCIRPRLNISRSIEENVFVYLDGFIGCDLKAR